MNKLKLFLTGITSCALLASAKAQVAANVTVLSTTKIKIDMSGSLIGPAPSSNNGNITIVLASASPLNYQNPTDSAFSPGRTAITVDGGNPFMSGQLINLDGEETIELYNSLSGLNVGDAFSGSVTIDYAKAHGITRGTKSEVVWGKPKGGTVQTTVPEPSSTALLMLGGLALVCRRKK